MLGGCTFDKRGSSSFSAGWEDRIARPPRWLFGCFLFSFFSFIFFFFFFFGAAFLEDKVVTSPISSKLGLRYNVGWGEVLSVPPTFVSPHKTLALVRYPGFF